MERYGTTRCLSKGFTRRFSSVNKNNSPYSNCDENQSSVEVFSLPEYLFEPMLVPKSSDGIDQKTNGNWGRYDGDCDRCVRLCDVALVEGWDARYEKGIHRRQLVVERIFDTFWGMEYEDSW